MDEANRRSHPASIVTIRVLDVNDHKPVFKDCKEQSIDENKPIGTLLTNLSATDKDRGVNKLIEYSLDLVLEAKDEDIVSNIRYYITSGNDGRFSMETVVRQSQENTGRLIISRPLDVKKSQEFERNPVYTLTVTATDGKHTATTTVTVRVS